MKEQSNMVYLMYDRDPSSVANSPMVQADQDTDLAAFSVKDLLVDSNRDSNSGQTLATSCSLSRHRMLFKAELSHMKDAHHFELKSLQASQKEAQEEQEAQLAASLQAIQDLQWQMSALQAKQALSAGSGAADTPQAR
jgi:hypothetical protein